MKRFVLDASVALAWAIDHPEPPAARKIRESFGARWIGVVPSLWVLEVANGLVLAERRGKLEFEEAERARKLYEVLMQTCIEVQTEPPQSSFRQLQETARKHNLTSYEAAYLLLATQQQLPLASLDSSMMVAAKKSGIELLT